jgi:hypothetical protein
MSNIILNMLNCNNTNANTGMQDCVFDLREVSGFIAVPQGTIITPAQQIVLQTTILAGVNNDNPTLRWYPFQTLWEIEDASSESTTETSSFGGVNYLSDGKPSFKMLHKHGVTMNKLYRKAFHLQQNRYDILLMDKKNKVLVGYADTASGLRGFDLEMFAVESWKIPTGSNGTAMYSISLGLSDSTQWNDDIASLKLPDTLNISQIVGLKQTFLNNATTSFTAGIATIQVLGSTTNLYDIYASNLNTLSIWGATNTSTGTVIPITAVVLDPAFKGVAITLDTASANYPSSAGAGITISFGSVSALTTANMPGLSESTLLTTRA